jgi:MFS family permease
MGALSIAFIATANSTIQMRVDATMRGRVMALYAIGFLGTAPVGAPLVGWISQVSSPRVALLVGASSTVVASAVIRLRHRNEHRRSAAEAAVGAAEAPTAGEVQPGSELGLA